MVTDKSPLINSAGGDRGRARRGNSRSIRLGAACGEVAAEEVAVLGQHLGEGHPVGGEGGAGDDAARAGAGQGGAEGEGELVEQARGGDLSQQVRAALAV